MSFQPQERGLPTLTGGLLECETELCELSAEFAFPCPGFQHTGLLVTSPALGFLRVQLPPWEILRSWSPAVLGLLFVGECQRCFSQVKSESGHHRCQGSM